ncbi:unnamed protein product [Prunus armeniaca]
MRPLVCKSRPLSNGLDPRDQENLDQRINMELVVQEWHGTSALLPDLPNSNHSSRLNHYTFAFDFIYFTKNKIY